MLFSMLVELVGTFVFLNVIMNVASSGVKWAALPIGLVLSAMIFWGGPVSGGHFNPAVSTMFYLNDSIKLTTCVSFVIAQLFGAFAALMFYKLTELPVAPSN